jgi:hypothetical protein
MAARRLSRRGLAAVRLRHDAELLGVEGVVGIGDGQADDGRPCIKVYVAKRTASLVRRLPREIEGYPVQIEDSGEFHAL